MTSHYTDRSRQFADALTDALAGLDDAPARDALAALVARCRSHAGLHPTALGAFEAFDAIAARESQDGVLSEAAALFASPQRFREALFFLRCLDRDPDSALRLIDAQSYLTGAVMPVSLDPDLARRQASLIEATTFDAMWQAPDRRHDMLADIDAWRLDYVPVYTKAHAANVIHTAAVLSDVEAARWQVDLLQRLNLLHRLGEAVGVAALMRFEDVASTFACGSDSSVLAADLEASPVCLHCGFRLGDRGGIDDLNAALVDIERALETQLARLDRHAVRRLTLRQGWAQDHRLRMLVEAVQNDNLPMLYRVLDEGMLDYLGDVLDAPEPRINLIDRLAQAHPEVTDDSMEAVVAAFRALVSDELRRSGGRVLIGREQDV